MNDTLWHNRESYCESEGDVEDFLGDDVNVTTRRRNG
jgi:hypothetical protein